MKKNKMMRNTAALGVAVLLTASVRNVGEVYDYSRRN